ncbi:MAG TPA: CHAP domain-containing protein [Candidatus Saccharimonadales bacterium]
MQKTNKKARNLIFNVKNKTVTFVIAGFFVLSGFSGYAIHVAAANCNSTSDCQAQINNLSNQNAQAQSNASALQLQAKSYQDAISKLAQQVVVIQSQIDANTATQANLQAQIVANEAEIAAQKAILASDIKATYVNGQMSTLEELASSKNLSDYVNTATYQNAVSSKVQSTLDQINQLELTLKSQKANVDQLIASQSSQRAQLNAAESQQSQLLNYDQAQQDQYNQQVSSNTAQISQLNARLAAINNAGGSRIVSSGVCGGGYPSQAVNPYYPGDGYSQNWGCSYPQDSSEDNWHMENRECVSYTAFMAYSKYGVSTANWGNAYQWIASARSHGFTVDLNPQPGDIAIRNRAPGVPEDVGHAMYVVSVNGPDNITVNEYNENYNGTFDQRTFAPSGYNSRGGLYFIHFH